MTTLTHHTRIRITAVLIIWLTFGLMIASAVRHSPTVDEQSKLFRGAAYLTENATHFLLGHPLFGSSYAALGTLLEPNLQVGTDQPFWESGNWSLAGDAFMWQLNENPQRLMFLGRLPIMWMALLLGALIFRWGKQLNGGLAGLLGMALLLLDPNFLAHGRLVTGDLLLTTFFTLTLYGFWGAMTLQKRPWQYAVLGGIGLGFASLTKFNAALLLPIVGALALLFAIRRRNWRPLLYFAGVLAVGAFVIVAFYRFSIRPLPGGAFWDDLFWVLDYFSESHGSYLFGQTSPNGWWYYFPVAYLLKTPTLTLLLLGWAIVLFGRQYNKMTVFEQKSALFLLWPPVAYMGIAMLSSLNIGYRHLLPMLPFLGLFTAVNITKNLTQRRRGVEEEFDLKTVAIVGVFVTLAIVPIWVFPNYIPYFNLLSGGSQNGWRLLSDSNVDWGQDLPALAKWQANHNNEPLYLSYFGTAHPSAYGINSVHIPTWDPTPEQGNPARQLYNPYNPAPGLYAISVNHLHGVVLGEKRHFYAPFREMEPLEKIGNSIFIYEVAATAEPIDVVYSHLIPADLDAALQFETNDVHIRWLEYEAAFLWPADGGWFVVDGTFEESVMAVFLVETAVSDYHTQAIYPLPPPPDLGWIEHPVSLEGKISYLGASIISQTDTEIELFTAWRSEQPIEQPLQIFVHALDANDQIIGQWDGINSDISSWLSGDVFVQFQRFAVSDGEVTQLATGLYDPSSDTRLGERIIINLQK